MECIFSRETYQEIVDKMVTVTELARAMCRDPGWVAKQMKLAGELYGFRSLQVVDGRTRVHLDDMSG